MSHDDEPEPTDEELRQAAELARALDGEADPAPGSDAAFATALRASRKLEPKLQPIERDRVVTRAMTRGGARARTRTGARWLAIAAAAVLTVGLPLGWALSIDAPPPEPTQVSFGGPTDAIFSAPFRDDQRASERMDRIASTRAHDYFAVLAAEAR